MKKTLIIAGLLILVVALSGCEKGPKIHPTKIKNEQGLAKFVPQYEKGILVKDIIDITDEMRYPEMKQYETAKYDFLVADSPQTVADWFLANLNGSKLQVNQASKEKNSKWIISWKELTIDIIPYGSGGALIRYKKLFGKE